MEIKLDKTKAKGAFAFHDNLEEDVQIVRIDSEIICQFTEEETIEFKTRKNDIKRFDIEQAKRHNLDLRKSTISKLHERGQGKDTSNLSFDKCGSKALSQSNPNMIKISSVIL